MPTPGSKDASPDDVLNEAELRALCQRAIVRTFAKNTVVVSEGDKTDSLYIVVSGRVKIYVSDDQGRRSSSTRPAPANTSARWSSTRGRARPRS